MPYRSQAQRRFMHARHPDIAARWDKEYPNQKGLPEKVGKMKSKKGKGLAEVSREKGKKKKGGTYAGAPAGSGKNFAKLKADIAKRGGTRDPGAVAAAIGRKKYGGRRMAKMAAAGRK